MHPAQLLQSRLFWRIVAGTVCISLVTVVAISLAGSTAFGLLVGLACGTVAGMVVAYLLSRRLARAADELAISIRDLGQQPLELPDVDSLGDEFVRIVDELQSTDERLRDRFAEMERHRTRLEQNTTLLQTVFGAMIEGVIVVDTDQQILFANDTATNMLEIRAHDRTERRIWEVARSRPIHEALNRVIDTGSLQRIEFELPRQRRTISLTAIALPEEPIPGVVIVLHDVTELRRLERTRQDFVSNVSHELKTPLTSIQAYADTLLEGAIDDAGHNRQFVERIVEQTERLRTLILDLLSLAKIESQQEVFEIQPVRIAAVVANCIDAHRAIAESKDVALICPDTVEDSVLMADPDGLRTILDNLVNNALNYTPAGGSVFLEFARDENWGEIRVRDTGVGIPRDQLPRIFERFYRVDKARSRAVGGTGLGLAIVKHLTQEFGGNVDVTSELGVGTTFRVRLPLAAEHVTTGD
ncbi:Alkaline phosphatase synthesis sensor protein PhoR [Maioricimonas rarisocia]|uniref:histidine kinase n=1 Tax=Maioricimonas rarisocia TaxID=2528026 RepID=A0A517Z3W6_9PLAN|nr:ATP-binding protein [Maioricimonas rarisocia]QDU37158.1 Alkaline phosphatase synthesis sensor protein PhoR [Maioricimonas rarisocia]